MTRAPTSPTSPDFGARLAAGAVALLPFGAYEQHGPHLPLDTDTVMALGVARRLAARLDALVLPAVGYGQTTDNDGFPGTISLSFDTVRAVLTDIATALHRHGARALVVVNGDFGNRAPLRIAAAETWARLGFPILILDYPGLEEAAAAVCTTPAAGFGLRHADEFETSVVLALDPGAVVMTRAVAEYPAFPATFPAVQHGLSELSRSGVFGDPTAATAAKGAELLELLTRDALALVHSFLATLVR